MLLVTLGELSQVANGGRGDALVDKGAKRKPARLWEAKARMRLRHAHILCARTVARSAEQVVRTRLNRQIERRVRLGKVEDFTNGGGDVAGSLESVENSKTGTQRRQSFVTKALDLVIVY